MCNDFYRLSPDWTRRPLGRRYATAVFCKSQPSGAGGVHATSQAIWWGLGTFSDGEPEFLGAWKTVDEKSGLPPGVFGDLRGRGVLSIRFCIGNIGWADAEFGQAIQHAAVIPSAADLLALSTDIAKPRHRLSVQDQLRSIAELENLAVARAEFAKFQGSNLGERYPEIVRQWNEALARFDPLYALQAPMRELVRSADRTAADLNARLNRAIKRHGPFADSTAALDFVVVWLDKAERDLCGRRTAIRALDTAAPSPQRGFLPAADAVGVPTLA